MINNEKQKQKADGFLALNHAPTISMLANTRDVASAKIFEIESFKAIGTRSGGISSAFGYADVQSMSLAENMQVVQRIVNNTSLPESADIEAGYATSIKGVVKAAQVILKIGAVGLNLKDSTGDPATPFFDVAL